MSIALNKRSVMTLFCKPNDILGHQIRFVLKEKDVSAEIELVHSDSLPQELLELSPYAALPTLIDRDLTLFDSHIALEYLDERFPHPPLMPIYPILRANVRLTLLRMRTEWINEYNIIVNSNNQNEIKAAQKRLAEDLTAISPIFKESTYFINDEFSLCDCFLGPLLWRLPFLKITLPKVAERNYEGYMDRIFNRPSFIESLTQEEKLMRE